MSEKLNLNVRAAIVVVEKTMEDLSKRKGDLSDLWTSWQLHVSHIKSVKKQWKRFKEQLKKVLWSWVASNLLCLSLLCVRDITKCVLCFSLSFIPDA